MKKSDPKTDEQNNTKVGDLKLENIDDNQERNRGNLLLYFLKCILYNIIYEQSIHIHNQQSYQIYHIYH